MAQRFEIPLHELVGFDYANALIELHSQLTYEQLAEALGYESKSTILKLLSGSVPSHIHGEAIWALYVQMFGKKPPLKSSPNETKPLKT